MCLVACQQLFDSVGLIMLFVGCRGFFKSKTPSVTCYGFQSGRSWTSLPECFCAYRVSAVYNIVAFVPPKVLPNHYSVDCMNKSFPWMPKFAAIYLQTTLAMVGNYQKVNYSNKYSNTRIIQ